LTKRSRQSERASEYGGKAVGQKGEDQKQDLFLCQDLPAATSGELKDRVRTIPSNTGLALRPGGQQQQWIVEQMQT